MAYYIPCRQVFYICKFHNEQLHSDGSFKCFHPSALEALHTAGVCSSNCVARKTLEAMIMPCEGNRICSQELKASQHEFDFKEMG
jgi:hypothetical protein